MAFGHGSNFSTAHVETVVHTFLETQGEVFALLRQSDSHDGAFRALAEFADADVAIAVVHRFNGTTLGVSNRAFLVISGYSDGDLQGVHLVLALCHLEGTPTALRPNEVNNPPFNALRSPTRNIANGFQGMGVLDTPQQAGAMMPPGRPGQSSTGFHAAAQQQYSMYPVVYHGLPSTGSRYVLDQTPTRAQSVGHMASVSPMSGSMPIMAPLYNTTPPATPMPMGMAMHGDFTSPRGIQPYGHMDGRLDSRLDGRRQNAMRVNRSPYFNNAGHHNHVDVSRIRDGIDVRTTVCFPRPFGWLSY